MAPAPREPPKAVAASTPAKGTGDVAPNSTPIRFGDFEPPAGPPPAAPPPRPGSEAAEGSQPVAEGTKAETPARPQEAVAPAMLQQQQQQQHMMVMQPTLAAGGVALFQCLPGMAPMPMAYGAGMQGQQSPGSGSTAAPPQQLADGQAAQGATQHCPQVVQGVPGALDAMGLQTMAGQQGVPGKQRVVQFMPFMPAMAGSPGMPLAGQQAMHMQSHQYVPVMFAVPFNPVSSEGGAGGNMQGMMMPMPMATSGEYGSCLQQGTMPGAGLMGVPMGSQQAMATMGSSCMPFASASESGMGGAPRAGPCETGGQGS